MPKLAFALAGFLIPALCWAEPEPSIDFSVRYYDVTGSTTDQIRASVFHNTPIRINGSPYGAVTENHFDRAYSAVTTSAGACEVKNVRVHLISRITLPRLVQNGQSEAVLSEWQRYIGALRAHEMMHAQNGRYTAETIASRLFSVKSAMPCPQMQQLLNAAVEQLIENMGKWDEQLDAKTEHGRSQGAFLRPGFQ